MGYVVTDRTPIRTGWRNYRTNPFAAAQMSGLGGLGDATSATIDPSTEMPGTGMTVAELLAQGFSAADIDTLLSTEVPGTGQSIGALLDLGYSPSDIDTMLQTAATPAPAATAPASTAGVPDGAILTYQGTWTAGGALSTSPQQIVSKVAAALVNDGVQVRSQNLSVGAGTAFLGGQFSVTLQVQVATGLGGFASLNDVISVIAHEVYVVTGQMPSSGTIPVAQMPSGAIGPTGQPASTTTAATTWSTWLQNNFTTVAILVVAVTVVPSLIDSFGGKRRR